MDWIRLSKSGKDLTGLKGRLIEVTEEELAKHNKRDDCWICLRGMFFTVLMCALFIFIFYYTSRTVLIYINNWIVIGICSRTNSSSDRYYLSELEIDQVQIYTGFWQNKPRSSVLFWAVAGQLPLKAHQKDVKMTASLCFLHPLSPFCSCSASGQSVLHLWETRLLDTPPP